MHCRLISTSEVEVQINIAHLRGVLHAYVKVSQLMRVFIAEKSKQSRTRSSLRGVKLRYFDSQPVSL
jgi:hypothetical protein